MQISGQPPAATRLLTIMQVMYPALDLSLVAELVTAGLVVGILVSNIFIFFRHIILYFSPVNFRMALKHLPQNELDNTAVAVVLEFVLCVDAA